MTTVPRREFIRIASAAVVASRSFWPLAARAQQPKKVPRIGYLSAGSPPPNRAFWQGMREFGYVESQNILVDYRWAEGKPERLPELTADLIRLKVEVVFAFGTQAALAAKSTATTTPVIFHTHADPVEAGFAASLARPGGNLTGLTLMAPQLVGKRLALLKEALPAASSVAVLVNTTRRSTSICGRPPRERDFQRQYRRKPARCQRTRVSGRMIVIAFKTEGNHRYSWIRNKRSPFVSWMRPLTFRRSTAS